MPRLKLMLITLLTAGLLVSFVRPHKDTTYTSLKRTLIEEQDSLKLDLKFWPCGLVCDDANLPILQDLYNYLSENPKNTFQIESYTDCRGGDFENVALSLKRSELVRSWLSEKGIVPERIVAKGFGGRRPLAKCACTECTPSQHVENRRVVFRLVNIYSSEGLADRVVLEKPWLKKQDHFIGKVAVQVCVGKRGRVSSVALLEEETTATDDDYIQQVLETAKSWSFTRAKREIQCGQIIYDFEQ
ncbi:MAG: OmpA family protein [Bacteroidota bacterium]